jgi:hypothetical protein
MGTYRSRKEGSNYFDPSGHGPHVWPEEGAVIDLLDKVQEESCDAHRDAIVKIVGDLKAQLHRAFNAFENITITDTLEDAHNQAHREVAEMTANEGEIVDGS